MLSQNNYFFHKFCGSFWRRHSLMNQPYYNNLFQIIHNFWNLNRVTFTQWKHLASRINGFWYCFKVIKQYAFHHLMKLVPFPGSKPEPFWNMQLFDTWCYQTFMILFFSSFVTLIWHEPDGVCLVCVSKLTRLTRSAIVYPYLGQAFK